MSTQRKLGCLLALVSLGCDTVGAIFVHEDGGVDAPISSDATPDQTSDASSDAPDDVTPPRVLTTSPADGALDVDPRAIALVTFSEPMAEAGTVVVIADALEVPLRLTWRSDGALAIEPTVRLPTYARVRVTLGDDFSDVAGHPIALPYTFTFDVGDVDPPSLIASDPPQGAVDVSARLDAVTLRFDELMDPSAGAMVLRGGPGTLGERRWVDGRNLSVEVSGLAYETAYQLELIGFTDVAGNPLERTSYLIDGALELSTGVDDEAPRVIDASPAEAQVNVSLRGTPSVTLVFDEPMRAPSGTATLEVGGESTLLPIVWDGAGLRATLPVAGRLRPDAPHRVVLAGLRDVEGNLFDADFYLGDGALDFDTGADVTAPVVVYSAPNEGSSDTGHLLTEIRVVFDRAMDPAITSLRVDDGVAPFDAPVTWNLARTIGTLGVAGRMHTGRTYRVDLRAALDLSGQPIDRAHPYLVDGVLDFRTRTPTGEQCRDEASIAEATARLPSGGYGWSFGPGSVSIPDDGASCPFPGSSTSRSPDAVVRYVKTSAAGSAGGRFLHVRATASSLGDRVALAVFSEACTAPVGSDARLTCLWTRSRWDSYLDVGPGTYFVWSGQTGQATLDGLTIEIEEVDAVPEGEGCVDPWDVGSAIHSRVSAEHVWDVPTESYRAVDMDDAFPGDGATSCEENQVQGTDFVIAFDKAEDDTLVSVVVEPSDDPFDQLTVEVRTSCDPRGDPSPPLACDTELRGGDTNPGRGPRRYTVAAPRGPLYVWLANVTQSSDSLGARVRIEEHEDTPGSSCDNAIALPLGTTAIAATSRARIDPPSCFAPSSGSGLGRLDDGITWYRIAGTSGALSVRADVPGGSADEASGLGNAALEDAASGRELRCVRDASSLPLTSFASGRDVCVAVRASSGIGALTVTSQPYAGVIGDAVDLAIEAPLGPTGMPINLSADQWLAATPSTLYLALGASLVVAPRSGGVRAAQRVLTSSQVGSAGLSIGEALFSLDDGASAGSSPRLFRLAGPSGAEDLSPWDATFSWPADAFDAAVFDGAGILVANDGPTSVAVQRFDAMAAGAPVVLGTLGATDTEVIGMAADATWIYFAGRVGPAATAQRGVFRVSRTALGLGGAVPELVAPIAVTTTLTSTTLRARVAMAVDDTTAAAYLYVRDTVGDVQVVADPGGAVPRPLGAVLTLGTSFDFAMTYDPALRELFLFETETESTGHLVRVR